MLIGLIDIILLFVLINAYTYILYIYTRVISRISSMT